ncbi:alpha/beta-hydrolase [Hyaloscypha variabilis]
MAQSFESNVSAEFPFSLKRVEVLESYMTYIDTGAPQTNRQELALFIHGNPVSTYLWRNIIPHVSPKLRCIAPDLIGFGSSGKPSIPYRFRDHAAYLSAFIDAILPNQKVILIVQDWGSALGFNWASQNSNRVLGLAFWEFLRPFPTFDDLVRGPSQTLYRNFRDPVEGRKLTIEQNAMIERVLPNAVMRPLTQVEHDAYRAPFLEKGAREPLFRVPNELPIEGQPADVWNIFEKFHAWLLESEMPKLLFWAKPGRLVTAEKAAWYLERLRNVKGVGVGDGLHFLEEDHPQKLGTEITRWISEVVLNDS